MADRIIGQIELMSNQREFVDEVYQAGAKVGLAIDFETPVSRLERDVLIDVDVVLVMSVPAGFGGQKFKEETLQKIKQLKHLREEIGARYRLCVDGGVDEANIGRVVASGADEVAIGRRLFANDLAANIEKFKASLAEHDIV